MKVNQVIHYPERGWIHKIPPTLGLYRLESQQRHAMDPTRPTM
jgi:hypothetical protein